MEAEQSLSRWISNTPKSDVRKRSVKLYRINKVTRPRGVIIKKKHILASTDQEAVKRAADSPDCPICDVLRDGKMVGSIV